MKTLEYIVEKFIDGEWWYEGRGSVEYVNRIINILFDYHIPIRIKEA